MFESSRTVNSLGGETIAALKASTPPVAVVGATMAGVGVDDWIKYATFVYIVLQASYLAFKFWRDLRTKKNG